MIERDATVRYRGLGVLGTVQSVWDVENARSYVVSWANGKTTTVPEEYLVEVPSQTPAQRVIMITCWSVLILLGLAVPIIGWVTLVPFAVWGLHDYLKRGVR